MVTLTLLQKFYGPAEGKVFNDFQKVLNSITSGLEAEIKIVGKTKRGWIQVEVSGSDIVVLSNYLDQKFGVAQVDIQTLKATSELKGQIIDSGRVGYGLYVDIGVSSPRIIDALIPLYALRSQLSSGEKMSTRKIIESYCLYENFPLKIKLNTINENIRLEAKLSEEQLKKFRNWIQTGLDRVIVLGAPSRQVSNAIKISGSRRDIIKVDHLGYLEHSLLCKLGTDAPGIINRLGRYLPRIPLHAFSPSKVKK